jgi:hypothetical protein
MRESIALSKEIRKLISEQIKEVRKELADTSGGSFEKRLKVIEVLATSLDKQGKGLDNTAKHLITEDGDAEAPEGDGDDIRLLEQLKGGH